MDSDDKPARPGSMSDGDRALTGAKERRAALGIPEQHTGDDRTPVGDVLPLVDDEAMRILLTRIWQHTANIEMRLMAQLAATSGFAAHEKIDDIAKQVDDITTRVIDISGKDGTNGKLGETRRGLASLTNKAWAALTGAVGMLITVAVLLVKVTRAFDAVEARSDGNAQRILTLEAQVLTLQTAALTHLFRPAPTPERNSP